MEINGIVVVKMTPVICQAKAETTKMKIDFFLTFNPVSNTTTTNTDFRLFTKSIKSIYGKKSNQENS